MSIRTKHIRTRNRYLGNTSVGGGNITPIITYQVLGNNTTTPKRIFLVGNKMIKKN